MPDLSMDFNSRYYLIESVQQVVDVIGENCIVTGLEVLSTSLTDRGLLTINLSKGKVICDKTLIDFPDNETLELDISSLPLIGILVLTVSFKYLRTSRPNFASFSIKHLQFPVPDGSIINTNGTNNITIGDPTDETYAGDVTIDDSPYAGDVTIGDDSPYAGDVTIGALSPIVFAGDPIVTVNTFVCTEWLPERDKIIISQLYYNKSNLSVNKNESTLKEEFKISINNKLYEVRPFTYVIQQLRPLLALI